MEEERTERMMRRMRRRRKARRRRRRRRRNNLRSLSLQCRVDVYKNAVAELSMNTVRVREM